MSHKSSNTFFLFLCSGTIELTDSQKGHMKTHFYLNHADFFGYSQKVQGVFVKFQKPQPCESSKEALAYRGMNVIGKKYTY